jgi:hypothetical protein
MQVNIRGKVYDSNEEPIMLILSNIDKMNIGKMDSESLKFTSFPETMTIKEVKDHLMIKE